MLKKTMGLILVCLMIAAIHLPVAAEESGEDSAKRTDIRRLMELTGAGDMGIQTMKQMITYYKQSNTGVPDKFWDDFMAEANAAELVEMCIPSYEKHFTHDEIKGLIAFFETDLGKKMIEKQGVIMQECMEAGQKWGMALGEKIAKKLQEEGYE